MGPSRLFAQLESATVPSVNWYGNTPARNSAALTNDIGVTAVASIGRADPRKTHQNHKTGDSRAPQM